MTQSPAVRSEALAPQDKSLKHKSLKHSSVEKVRPLAAEKVVEIELSADEKAMLQKSADAVQSVVDVVKKSAG